MLEELTAAQADGAAELDKLARESLEAEAKENPDADLDAEFASIEIPVIGTGDREAAAFHAFKAFAAANVEDDRINQALKKSLEKSLAEGESFEEWKKQIDKEFDRLGVTKFKSYRLQTIYRTESQLAFGGSQFARLQKIKHNFPLWEYSAILDQRTRPSHAKLSGSIFRADDNEFWPPLGWNCRCTAKPVSKWEARRRKLKPTTVTPEMRGNLQNVEFIGDKVGSYNDWLNATMQNMQDTHRRLIQQAFNDLLQELEQLLDE